MGRFARQMKLKEVGPDGQAKIATAEVMVAAGFAGSVEAKYLAAAGVRKIEISSQTLADPRFDSLDPAAREVALGAHAAIVAIKNIVG